MKIMRTKRNEATGEYTYSPVKLNLYNVIARFLFRLTFVKIPKKQNARCVTCKANQVCSKFEICKCSDNQQYDLRLNWL